MSLIDSKIAGLIRLKLGGKVEGMQETSSGRNFLDLSMLTKVRSVGHRCLF